ncbi:MAG TPA: hypothetical protein VH763_10565 [Gemmatimonadales bacterium]
MSALFPSYLELRERLLELGGIEVVLPRYDEYSQAEQQRQAYDVMAVLQRGQTWDGADAALERGEANGCHTNVARLARAARGSIISGWALAADGLWREHSWLLAAQPSAQAELIETTEAWLLYHGYRLDLRETGWFIRDELGPDATAPGAA